MKWLALYGEGLKGIGEIVVVVGGYYGGFDGGGFYGDDGLGCPVCCGAGFLEFFGAGGEAHFCDLEDERIR